jgi:hypothetical protein
MIKNELFERCREVKTTNNLSNGRGSAINRVLEAPPIPVKS